MLEKPEECPQGAALLHSLGLSWAGENAVHVSTIHPWAQAKEARNCSWKQMVKEQGAYISAAYSWKSGHFYLGKGKNGEKCSPTKNIY